MGKERHVLVSEGSDTPGEHLPQGKRRILHRSWHGTGGGSTKAALKLRR